MSERFEEKSIWSTAIDNWSEQTLAKLMESVVSLAIEGEIEIYAKNGRYLTISLRFVAHRCVENEIYRE